MDFDTSIEEIHEYKSIGISIGWDCSPAIYAVYRGLRETKEKGYNTCPFDLMITNYEGIIECIRDDFKYLCDTNFIQLKTVNRNCEFLAFKQNEELIVNTKYNFIFNHESPDHGDLYKLESWSNGRYHFCNNNFEEFVNRYTRRIQNLRTYLASGVHIKFVISRVNGFSCDYAELVSVIKKKYPTLKFSIVMMDEKAESRYNEYISMDFII
jgi:hypothetical protein